MKGNTIEFEQEQFFYIRSRRENAPIGGFAVGVERLDGMLYTHFAASMCSPLDGFGKELTKLKVLKRL